MKKVLVLILLLASCPPLHAEKITSVDFFKKMLGGWEEHLVAQGAGSSQKEQSRGKWNAAVAKDGSTMIISGNVLARGKSSTYSWTYKPGKSPGAYVALYVDSTKGKSVFDVSLENGGRLLRYKPHKERGKPYVKATSHFEGKRLVTEIKMYSANGRVMLMSGKSTNTRVR